jgi:hypothetical protein
MAEDEFERKMCCGTRRNSLIREVVRCTLAAVSLRQEPRLDQGQVPRLARTAQVTRGSLRRSYTRPWAIPPAGLPMGPAPPAPLVRA